MPSAAVLEPSPSAGDLHKVKIIEHPAPALKANQALVRMNSVALNHREFWILKGLYPGQQFGSVLGADGVGHITQLNGPSSRLKVNDRVVVMPSIGWYNDVRGPEKESEYSIIGGTAAEGTFTEQFVGEQDNLFKAPEYLTDIEAAALPLAGLTAYRALFTKGLVTKGQNVLITGIGGGVALLALQFAHAVGANVFVTSSDEVKIQKAIELGAKGGMNYKKADWPEKLLEATNGELIDVVIDGASGPDGATILTRLLRAGGIFVNYGITAGDLDWSITAILRNVELKASTMGSRKEFEALLEFVTKYQIRPVVSEVFQGLQKTREAIDVLQTGSQFGKVVITL
ncbi:hypothetical protein BGW38_000782 [Lunasporangiospora selenospora]|uniref:Enoyl reductase (ER) domain-containing protein n=1 Tax=Lunasporangiospora selenospora TaxID=979761 RepID=A0A9P6FWK2_9FUNG|nr:hypothetical protein BGW38_000782 [Lunasporangiospora selenospora]